MTCSPLSSALCAACFLGLVFSGALLFLIIDSPMDFLWVYSFCVYNVAHYAYSAQSGPGLASHPAARPHDIRPKIRTASGQSPHPNRPQADTSSPSIKVPGRKSRNIGFLIPRRSGMHGLLSPPVTQGRSMQFNTVRVVHKPVQHRVREGRVLKDAVPCGDR